MNYFRYKLIAPSGETSSGIIKLTYKDVMSAISHLERDGSMTIYVKKLGAVSSFIFRLGEFRVRKKLSRAGQAEILSNMSLMLRSGIPITPALEEAVSGLKIPDVKTDINDMIMRIQGGATFSEVADKYRYIFPKTVIHLIRIGEETGKLDSMLKDASEHLKRVDTIISDTKQALIYPSFVFLAMGGGLVFWFYAVVPKILGLFKEMDVRLPAITVFLVKLSDFVQDYFFHMVFGLAIAIFAVVGGRRGSQQFKKTTDALLLKLPLSGTVISASTMAFITEYFSLLLNAGIDILQSVSILKDSLKNEIYREKLGLVMENLKRGEAISDSFKATAIFPLFVTRMINIGEMSGSLPEQLAYIAEEYRTKLSILVATMGKVIEPVVLVVAGAIFAVIVGGLFLPIYDLITKVSR